MEREEDVLRQVLALRDRAEDAREPAVHRIDVCAVERRERGLIAGAEARDELVVIGLARRYRQQRGEDRKHAHGDTSIPAPKNGATSGVVAGAIPARRYSVRV